MDNFGAGGNLYITGNSIDISDVDSIKVSAMDPVSLTVVDVTSGILKLNGDITVTFSSNVIEGNSYYLKVNHRNSIETWSAQPVLMLNNTNYDFTLSSSQAYGSNQVQTFDQMGWAFYSGDFSDAGTGLLGIQDGVIESQDYGDMENAVAAILTGYVYQDISGDGVVESTDYSLMENNVASIIFTLRP